MRVTVRFFASHREATGLSSYVGNVSDGTSAEDILRSLYSQFPKLKALTGSVAFAVNQQQVPATTVLRDGDELALLPPMAGG
ncbi:MAG TPA: MoaD/ThiS family protein [Candidatus Eremiobacteraceae bacterium]|nr:MoaD/ThiS family protein [Candidatus Eremiobacteraceae bacterium]